MRKIIALMVCVILGASAGCARLPEPKPPIKIAINVWPGFAHAFIAKEKGFFEKNGVQVELILKKEQIDSLQLYKDGGADGLFTVVPDVMMLNARSIGAVIVCVTDYSETGDVIVGRPEFNSLADLKGKRVSFEGVNTFSNIFVLKSLENAGLKEYDIYFENLPAHEVLTALEEGRIDAGHTWEPTKSAALRKGYKVLAEAKSVPGVITGVLVLNADIIRERPVDIKAILKSLFEALDFIRTNRDEALKIMADSLGIGIQEMSEGLSAIVQFDVVDNIKIMKESGSAYSLNDSWCTIFKYFSDRGQIGRIPNYEDVVNSSFIDEAAAEMISERHR